MPDFAVIYFNAASNNYEFVKGPNPNQTFTAVDGTSANATACLENNKDGKYVAFSVAGPTPATYQTSFEAPLNTNLVFTAKEPGDAGNDIRIRYVVAGNNTPLSVAISGSDITVNLATGAGGAPTSTASAVLNELESDVDIDNLIEIELAPGETGAGVIPEGFAYVNLQYGSPGAAVATIVEQVETTDSTLTTF